MKRTYPKGCDWCNATGYVHPYYGQGNSTTPLTNVCPVCGGTGVVTVTEIIEEDAKQEG